jgi:Mn2+/Fe2+ NRAMP family transporter
VAVIFGGIISMAVLITGSVLDVFSSFDQLASALTSIMGRTGKYMLGAGLFAAGLTSAVTAPLAAAVTVRSLWGMNQAKWETTSLRFKSVWMIILGTGIIMGLTDISPVPAIILAQALNGLILPVISIYLLFLLNNKRVMGADRLNGRVNNAILGLVVTVMLLIGLTNIVLAAAKALEIAISNWDMILFINTFISLSVILIAVIRIYHNRRVEVNKPV